jgi:TetR/AcrR family transcriptional regulator, mexJK operon transcriptional repressor
LFYEEGAGRTIAALADSFARLAVQGVLLIDDPVLAASQFNWLIMSAPMNQAMLLGQDEPPSVAELRRLADRGVATFLAAFRRQGTAASSASSGSRP